MRAHWLHTDERGQTMELPVVSSAQTAAMSSAPLPQADQSILSLSTSHH